MEFKISNDVNFSNYYNVKESTTIKITNRGKIHSVDEFINDYKMSKYLRFLICIIKDNHFADDSFSFKIVISKESSYEIEILRKNYSLFKIVYEAFLEESNSILFTLSGLSNEGNELLNNLDDIERSVKFSNLSSFTNENECFMDIFEVFNYGKNKLRETDSKSFEDDVFSILDYNIKVLGVYTLPFKGFSMKDLINDHFFTALCFRYNKIFLTMTRSKSSKTSELIFVNNMSNR